MAWSDNDGTDAESLVALADAAMYESKRREGGGATLADITPEMAA